VLGLRSGQTGKREAEESGAGRRIGKPAGLSEERIGDIAHLETGDSISLFVRLVKYFRILFAYDILGAIGS
jgi:hypothetical protein